MTDQIRALQGALSALGYDPGPADGLRGPRTEAALFALADDWRSATPPQASRTEFFDAVRGVIGRLTAAQVEGLDVLLDATEGLPITHRAYLLATTAHETARTFQPITEYGGLRYFDKYDTGKLAAALGNTPEADGDGYRYRGRGYVQITGRANYARAGAALGVNLIADPDAALRPAIAAQILVRGCSEGWFTGRSLYDFLPGDYVGARRVVNGTDRARDIAKLAYSFESSLKHLT